MDEGDRGPGQGPGPGREVILCARVVHGRDLLRVLARDPGPILLPTRDIVEAGAGQDLLAGGGEVGVARISGTADQGHPEINNISYLNSPWAVFLSGLWIENVP